MKVKEITSKRGKKENKWSKEGYIYLRPRDYMEIFERKSYLGTAGIRPFAVKLKMVVESMLLKDILMGGKLGKDIQKMVERGVPLEEAMKRVYNDTMEQYWGVPNEEREKLLRETWSKKRPQTYL